MNVRDDAAKDRRQVHDGQQVKRRVLGRDARPDCEALDVEEGRVEAQEDGEVGKDERHVGPVGQGLAVDEGPPLGRRARPAQDNVADHQRDQHDECHGADGPGEADGRQKIFDDDREDDTAEFHTLESERLSQASINRWKVGVGHVWRKGFSAAEGN